MKPWDKRHDETTAAYARFRAWLAMEPPRSYRLAAEAMKAKANTIGQMAKRHDWSERAAAWDAEVSRRVAEAALDKHAELAKAHITAATLVWSRGVEVLRDAERVGRATPADAARMVVEGVKLQRLLLGEATMRGELATKTAPADPCEGLDLTLLSDDELVEFRRLLDKATPGAK